MDEIKKAIQDARASRIGHIYEINYINLILKR